MAYSLPPKDDRSSLYFSPTSPNRSYFADRAIPSVGDLSGYPPTTVDYRDAEFHRYPTDLRDPVEREREKQRIREEIMAEQMARRRILEEEVRRELMLEREVTMRRWESSRMLFDSETSRIPQSFGHYEYEERRLPLLPVMPMSSLPVDDVGILRSSPYQRQLMRTASSSLDLRDNRYLPEPREDTILLAEREPKITGVNRKREASTLEADHRHRARNFETKPIWRCKLCKITTTDEMNLKQHYQGKKHKLMKQGLLPEEMKERPLNNIDKPGPSHPILKKARQESGNLSEKAITDKKQKNKPNGSGSSTTPDGSSNKRDNKQKNKSNGSGSSTTPDGSLNKREPRFLTTLSGSSRKRDSGSSTTPGDSVNKFRFWCEICQVGATAEVVFASHMNGKKHMAKLEELTAEPGSSFAMPQGL